MGIKLNNKDLKKLMKNAGQKNNESLSGLFEKKETEAQRQLRSAIEKLKNPLKEDKIFLNEDATKCVVYLKDATLLSNNISLRLGAKQMSEYKELWHQRIKDLVKPNILKKWGDVEDKKFFIEFCYEVNCNHMDYDGKVSAFKAPLDGLTKANLIKDDDEKHLSMILAKQRRSKSKIPNLIIMISLETDPDRYFSDDFKDFLETI